MKGSTDGYWERRSKNKEGKRKDKMNKDEGKGRKCVRAKGGRRIDNDEGRERGISEEKAGRMLTIRYSPVPYLSR